MWSLVIKWWWSQRARWALLRNHKQQALKYYEFLLRADPDDVSAHMALSNLAAELGDHGRAEREILRILSAWPGHAVAHYNLGYLLDQRDALNESEQCFRRAVEHDPQLDRAWYGLGLCLIKQGRLAEAERPLEACTQLRPMHASGWYQLARLRQDLGQDLAARQIMEHLAHIDPAIAAQLERELDEVDEDSQASPAMLVSEG